MEYRMQLLETYCEKLLDIQADIDVLNPAADLPTSVENMCIITKALHRSAMRGVKTQRQGETFNKNEFSGKHFDFKNFLRAKCLMTHLLQI